MKPTIYILGSVITALFMAGIAVISTSTSDAFATAEVLQTFAIQNTSTSMQDPLPGHEAHQIVIALPPRDDGTFYSGKVTYTASKPVEVVVLNPSTFNATTSGEEFGEALSAPFGDGKVGISLMEQFTGATNAGSLSFVGSALAFHTVSGEKFSVTYATTGEVVQPTELEPTGIEEEEEE